MKRTLEELLTAVNTVLGDNTSDEALGLIEDISDSFTPYNGGEDMDWKSKYDELDKSWRQRYKDRFLKGGELEEPEETHEEPDGDEVPKTFENLFKEE